MSRYSFRGNLTLTSPLHVAEPGSSRYDAENRVFNDNSTNGWPATRTRRMRIVDGRPLDIPYFPSNDLRGRLRRKATSLIVDHLIQTEQKISLGAFHVLSCGAVTGQPAKGGAYVFKDVLYARSHLFMGLFGGGPRLYASGLRTYDLMPRIAATENAGLVPAGETQAPEVAPSDLLYAITITRRDDLLRLVDERHGKVISEWPESLVDWSNTVIGSRTKRKRAAEDKDAPEARKADLDNMAAFEVVAPGTQFHLQADIASHLSEAHVGLMAHAFALLAQENALGGWTRNGLGRFTANLKLYDGDEPLFNILSRDGTSVTVDDAMSEFTDAYTQALATVTGDDLEQFTAGAVDAAA